MWQKIPSGPLRAYIIVLALLAIATFIFAPNVATLKFQDVSGGRIVDLLTPLFVIALFLERAQEVFITAWRETGKIGMAVDKLKKYQKATQRYAFLFGMSIGIVISIVGVRALEPLVNPDALNGLGYQKNAFKFLDVLLTGALIGGGSDALHKLITVITDSLDATRSRINKPQGP